MRFVWFAGAAAIMVVIVAPWLMATFDSASYSNELLGIIHPATGSTPIAKVIAEICETSATKHGLVAQAKVTVSAPRIDNPNKPDDPDNRVQDVHIEVAVEKKLWVGTKRSRFTYNLALGGKGTANAWPEE